jgi:hypothetical protein
LDIREYFEKLYSNKFKFEEMDMFLDILNLPKLNQEGINNLNRAITCHEISLIGFPKKANWVF